LKNPDREQEVLHDFHVELESDQHRREASSHGSHGSHVKVPKPDADS
jgi:hypothetical protein